MPWQAWDPGCSPCGCAPSVGQVCVSVSACTKTLTGATVTLSRTPVTGVTVTGTGTGYTNGSYTTGAFSAATGSGGTFSFQVSGGSVVPSSILITSGGSYLSAPAASISGAGPGSGFAGTGTLGGTTTYGSCTTVGQVTGITRTAAGTGYANGSYTNGTFSGGGGSGATFSYTVSGTAVTSVTLTGGGSGYTSAPTAVISAGPGTGFAATVTFQNQCCIPFFTTGTYTVSFARNGLVSQNRIANLVAGNNGIAFTPSLATGYSCCGGTTLVYFPDTLTITDDNGTHTFTGTGNVRSLSYTVVKPTAWKDTGGTWHCESPVTGTTTVSYTVQCITSGAGVTAPYALISVQWAVIYCCNCGLTGSIAYAPSSATTADFCYSQVGTGPVYSQQVPLPGSAPLSGSFTIPSAVATAGSGVVGCSAAPLPVTGGTISG